VEGSMFVEAVQGFLAEEATWEPASKFEDEDLVDLRQVLFNLL